MSQTGHKLTFNDRRFSNRRLLPIHFTSSHYRRGKFDPHIGRSSAVKLDDAHDNLVTLFRLLECEHTNATIVDAQDRKRLSQSSRMLRTLKRDQRLIKTLRLPVSLFTTPITAVRRKTVNKLVSPPVLR